MVPCPAVPLDEEFNRTSNPLRDSFRLFVGDLFDDLASAASGGEVLALERLVSECC